MNHPFLGHWKATQDNGAAWLTDQGKDYFQFNSVLFV